jgi:Protein of unknown function (DUF3716).
MQNTNIKRAVYRQQWLKFSIHCLPLFFFLYLPLLPSFIHPSSSFIHLLSSFIYFPPGLCSSFRTSRSKMENTPPVDPPAPPPGPWASISRDILTPGDGALACANCHWAGETRRCSFYRPAAGQPRSHRRGASIQEQIDTAVREAVSQNDSEWVAGLIPPLREPRRGPGERQGCLFRGTTSCLPWAQWAQQSANGHEPRANHPCSSRW